MPKVLAIGLSGPQELEVASVAGTDRSVQFNNAEQLAGTGLVSIDLDGNLRLGVDNTPPTPAAGLQTLHLRQVANRTTLATINESATLTILQPNIVGHDFWAFVPVGYGSAVVSSTNISMTVLGTAASATLGLTSLCLSSKRVRYSSAAAAGAIVSIYTTVPKMLYAPASPLTLNGFTCIFRISVEEGIILTDARQFIGISNSTVAPTNVDPATLLNTIGLIKRTTDTNLQFYAAGASAGTVLDLGANFPINTNSVDVYELTLHNPRGSTSIHWHVLRVNTGNVASGVVTAAAQLPANGTYLGPRAFRITGATGTASFALHYHYGESPR